MLWLKKLFLVSLTMILLLAGCKSDMKEIQQINYPTAIGVDFKDGKYHLYLQLIALDSIAKSDGQEAPPQILVSETTAPSFIETFFKVYETGQQRFLWAHVTSLILSESVLKEGFENVFDGISRYYEFRLTPWVFATKEPVDEVLAALGLFNQSALETILHRPQSIFEQSSIVRPIRLHQFCRELFEPGLTTHLPSLSIDETQWKKDQKKEPKLALNGAFFISSEEYKGFYTLDELKGLRWIVPETKRASVLVPNKENPDFLSVIDVINKQEITLVKIDEQISFKVELILEGNVANRMNGEHLLGDMQEQTAASISQQINDLYHLGVEKGTDFLNFEHIFYKERNSEWNELSKSDFLQKTTLEDITVQVNLKHTGGYKNRLLKLEDAQ